MKKLYRTDIRRLQKMVEDRLADDRDFIDHIASTDAEKCLAQQDIFYLETLKGRLQDIDDDFTAKRIELT